MFIQVKFLKFQVLHFQVFFFFQKLNFLFETGKTQFCLSETLFVSSKTKGTVIYIDTNNSFSDTRLREMHLEMKNKDPEILPILLTFRDKIKVIKSYNIDSFLLVQIKKKKKFFF